MSLLIGQCPVCLSGVSLVLESSLLASPDLPVVSAADGPLVAVAISAVKFPGAPAVATVSAPMSLLGATAAAGMLATAQVSQQKGRQQQ